MYTANKLTHWAASGHPDPRVKYTLESHRGPGMGPRTTQKPIHAHRMQRKKRQKIGKQEENMMDIDTDTQLREETGTRHT